MTWHTALAFTMAILATSVLAADDNSVVANPAAEEICPRRLHAAVDCPTCHKTTPSSGYVADPCDKACYYQCQEFDDGWYMYEPVCCPPCLMFNETIIGCMRDPDVDCAVPDPVDLLQEEFNCTMAPLNDPRMFLMANVSMPCPEGTVFKEVNCSCIHDPDYPPPISMTYTIRSELVGSEFEHTLVMDTTKSPFIVMIRQAHKLKPEFMFTSKIVQNLGDYILSVNGLYEDAPDYVWVFMKEVDGIECMPDQGVNQYRVTDGEHLILAYVPRSVYSDNDVRCP